VSLRFHLDFPSGSALPSRFLRMRGWAFCTGRHLSGVRLTVPGHAVDGIYGLARPDVRASFPEAPDDATGFEVRARLPAGHAEGRLAFRDADGTWIEAGNFPFRTPRWTVPAWWLRTDARDLIAFQLAAHPSHAPHAIRTESFPPPRSARDRWPRFSIVTPSFQQRPFLAQTISSVLDQGGPEVEYVMQDGGSTDGSVELICSHESRLKAWQSVRDAGQTDAIAQGFEKTSGRPEDVMAWINSDDFYMPGALTCVADFFARHPDADVVYGHRILVDENSREIGRWFLPAHDAEVLRLNDFVPQETLFWRRRSWERAGGLDRSFRFAMDWDLLLRLQATGARIVRLPYFLGCFRVHAAQKTSALLRTTGQDEIDRLRARTFGRPLAPEEIERDPRLAAYLRRSAWLEFAHRFGYRGPSA
jgi:hypothetical protein